MTQSKSRAGSRIGRHRVRRRLAAAVSALAGALALILAPAASADFGFIPGSVFAKTHAPLTQAPPFGVPGGHGIFFGGADVAWLQAIVDAPAMTQAGSHPDLTTSFAVNVRPGPAREPDDYVKDLVVDTPAGFSGNPQAVSTCTAADFYSGEIGAICPPASQVGVASVDTGAIKGLSPVYNLVPPPGSPALMAFKVATVTSVLYPTVRSDSDYGLRVTAANIPTVAGTRSATVTLWGVPHAPIHDVHRFDPATGQWGVHVPSSPEPFLTAPANCETGPLTTTIKARSWEDQDTWIEVDDTAAEPTDCDQLDFGGPGAEAKLTAHPESHAAGSPTGLDVNLRVPYNDDPDLLARPTLRDAEVTLPEGMAINPAAASGLGACTEQQIGLHSLDPEGCPKSSKLGTVQVDTPLLEKPMKGAVYQATQDENPFNSTFAIYIAAEGAGVQIKLAGEISPDPETGQLTASFLDNPQLPFTNFNLRFFGGPHAALVNPPTCGTKTTNATLTPWSAPDSGPPVESTDTFEITSGPDGGPCVSDLADRPFDPEMTSGVVNPVAGSFSPFVFRLTREDGDQEILSTEVTPPEGVTGKLAGIPLCSDEDAEAGTCDEASKVGEVIAGAGAGPTPFYIQGDDAGSVYLSGPYDPDGPGGEAEAPLSLQIQVPAIAGPFDLGVVNVRAAMFVDKRTAQIRVVSDPIPQILEGVPLRVKDMRIKMNRDAFTIAPTSCNEMQVTGHAEGTGGATADLTNRFQVGDCANLDFSPKLRLNYRGKGSRKASAHPRLAANLKIPGADSVASGEGATQANIDKVRVVLPKGTFLDQAALSRVCTPTQWEAEDCPEDSKIGHAKAWTPLLDEPLKGPVYLKVGPNELPDMAADLNGVVPIDLIGKIDQSKGRIRNTFQVVPDVAVERFRLNLRGGDGGLLVNSKDICKGKKKLRRANVNMRAHNGARLRDKQSVVRCGKRKRRKAHGSHRQG